MIKFLAYLNGINNHLWSYNHCLLYLPNMENDLYDSMNLSDR